MGLGACLGAGGAGVALLVGVAAAYVVATGDRRSPNPAITDAGWTLQCGVPLCLVAMSIVLLARLDQGSAIALLLLVSAYEPRSEEHTSELRSLMRRSYTVICL